MIQTEDNQFVANYDPVFEIRYVWLNAEVSIAESFPIIAKEAKGKIWLDVIQCDRECIRLNSYNTCFYSSIANSQTIKTIAHAHSC